MLQKIHILLVDDTDYKIAKVKTILIETHINCEIVSVKDAISAQQALSKSKFDLMILDMCLPIRLGQIPQNDGGESVLHELDMDKSLNMPNHIIVLTQYQELTEKFRLSFPGLGIVTFDSSSEVWVNALKGEIRRILRIKPTEEERLMNLIQKGEGLKKIEFKSTLQWDIREGKKSKSIEHSAMKTIVSFANSDGGTLFIGIEDNKNIIGIADYHESEDKFSRLFDDILKNFIGDFAHSLLESFEFIYPAEKSVFVIQIKKSVSPIYLVKDKDGKKVDGNGHFYIRGSTSARLLNDIETDKYIKEHFNQ